MLSTVISTSSYVLVVPTFSTFFESFLFWSSCFVISLSASLNTNAVHPANNTPIIINAPTIPKIILNTVFIIIFSFYFLFLNNFYNLPLNVPINIRKTKTRSNAITTINVDKTIHQDQAITPTNLSTIKIKPYNPKKVILFILLYLFYSLGYCSRNKSSSYKNISFNCIKINHISINNPRYNIKNPNP